LRCSAKCPQEQRLKWVGLLTLAEDVPSRTAAVLPERECSLEVLDIDRHGVVH
jgi:hypothetical protein